VSTTVADAYVALASEIIRSTADAYLVAPDEIIGPSRVKGIVTARAATAYRLWQETDLSLARIGEILGGRDHSSIHYLIRRHELAQGESLTRKGFEPWIAVKVGVRKNRKLAGLPDDTARYGWIAGVLAEAKLQRPGGRFDSRGQLEEAIGRFAIYVDNYLAAGLLEVAGRLCTSCRKVWTALPVGVVRGPRLACAPARSVLRGPRRGVARRDHR
jgi:hypothetical protein